MARFSVSKLMGQNGPYSLETLWASGANTEGGLATRLFRLFSERAELGGASESAQAVSSATERNNIVRAPELAAISIPAFGVQSAWALDPEWLSAALESGPRWDSGEAGDSAARIASVQFTAAAVLATDLQTVSGAENPGNLAVIFGDNLDPIGLYDTSTKQLMQGGPGDYPELGQGADDVLEVSGDFSQGFTLGQTVRGLDTIILRGGNDYNFTATDELVEAGKTLTISAMPLQRNDRFLFDGSGETDGRFVFFGSGGADSFIGGAGDDRIYGHAGADLLAGGRGRDTFVYTLASESTGAGYDTIGDFDVSVDLIDLERAVDSFMNSIEGGSLSQTSFDADLGAAASGLGANQAVLFTADEGDLAGTVFLVVDGNGQTGYQSGEDYVIAIGGVPLEDLTGKTDFII